MANTNRLPLLVLALAGLHGAACNTTVGKTAHGKPAHVERVEGSELSRVTLTPKAAERLDIKTASVSEVAVAASAARQAGMNTTGGQQHLVVPYAAVLYDPQGTTWVYTSPAPLVFVRHRIKVDYIVGDLAVLSEGPPVGTTVVTTGGAELFGAEFEIGH